jgi:orotate phosphoribosyltransferase-like protein
VTSCRNDERDAHAYALRIAGHTFAEIGERLNVSTKRAWELVKRMHAENAPDDDTVAEWRALQLARLETMHGAVWPAVLEGDLRAVDRALRIAAQTARLLNLDRTETGPQPSEITVILHPPSTRQPALIRDTHTTDTDPQES